MTAPNLQETIEALERAKMQVSVYGSDLLSDAITLLKAQQWISVEDRLPEWHTTVLVHGGCANFDGDAWYSCMEGFPYREIQWEVTHWMPLPAPPQTG